MQYLIKWKGYPESENQWVDWDNLHADEMIADFKKKNPAAVSHIKAEGSKAEFNSQSPMSDDDRSSAPLTVISPADMPPEVRQLFLNWRPTIPSSWTTPPESDGENTAVLTGSSPIQRDYYQPQTLVATNLSLHAVHTPYTTDHALPNNTNNSSEDSFPCPTPEVANTTSPSPDPIPIPP